MLKKGENYLTVNVVNRKHKPSENSQNYSQYNKENLSSKSLFDQIDTNSNHNKSKHLEQHGSNMVSPTFQANSLISLKDDPFKQNKGYLQVNLNLRDLNKKQEEIPQSGPSNLKKFQHFSLREEKLNVEESQRLKQHYQNKRYWKKIEKLWDQDGLGPDAVQAWADCIGKYLTLKQQLEQTQQQSSKLRDQLDQKNQIIKNLEKQSIQDKNQTRVVSQKKCKGCENLEQKEKKILQLFQQSKKQAKQLKDHQQELSNCKKQLGKMEEKYLEQKSLKEQMQKKRALFKQEIQKKNAKLIDKEKAEKEIKTQLLKFQNSSHEYSKLHIECQQLKQFKYQAQKNIVKLDEKHKKELNQLLQNYKDLQQEKGIYEQQMNKLRSQLSQLKPKVLKTQIELESQRSSLVIKNNECQQLKKKHIQSMTEQIKKKNQLEALSKQKEDQLNKAYQLIDEGENLKLKLQFQLNHQRKINEDKEEQINKYIDIINKSKQNDSQQTRAKEGNFYHLTKAKNPLSSASSQSNGTPNNGINRKIFLKIKEIFTQIKQINDQSLDSLQRRRYQEDDSQQRESLNSFQLQKYVNEIHCDLSKIINKYHYILKQHDILKEQLQNQQQYKQDEVNQIKKEISLKEQTLRSILSFIPEELKDTIIDLLQSTETLITNQHPQDNDIQEFDELRQSLQNQGKEWRQNYQRMKFKFRKMEDDLRRLQEENQQLKRRTRGKEVKKTIPTDYDYNREVVSKKDIRKKYNFGL